MPARMSQDMVDDFRRQTGQSGDVAEYADPRRSGITEEDSMAHVGPDTPWHRLSTYAGATAITSADMIIASNLGWTVEERPVFVPQADGLSMMKVDGRKALVRSDTDRVLSVRSDRYQVLQNTRAFEAFDAVVANGEAIYETAGSLWGGRKIWIMARLPEDLDLGDGDLISRNLALINSHDGTMKIRWLITPIRIVCQNTTRVAIEQAERQIAYSHTGDLGSKVDEIREHLGVVNAYYQLLFRSLERMRDTLVSEQQQVHYAQAMAGYNPDLPDKGQARRKAAFEWINNQIQTQTLSTEQGTAWGMFNAVTDWIDHQAPVKGRGAAKAEARLGRSWLGDGADMRQRAFEAAYVYVGNANRDTPPEKLLAIDPATGKVVPV